MKKKFEILYEDKWLVIVNKMSGIPVIPGRTSEMGISLKYLLKEKYGEIFIVHRIDSDTSGLVMLAKDRETHRKLNLLFQHRKINKTYLLLTRGIPSPREGEIQLALKKLSNQNKSVVSKEGKEAYTKYHVKKSFGNISLVEAEILTGRHHQLRVHFAAINTPLLVDPVYSEEAFFLSEIKGKKYKKAKHEEERPLLSRLSLHAHQLKFVHPMTDERVDLIAEFPKDIRAVINQLGKAF